MFNLIDLYRKNKLLFIAIFLGKKIMFVGILVFLKTMSISPIPEDEHSFNNKFLKIRQKKLDSMLQEFCS